MPLTESEKIYEALVNGGGFILAKRRSGKTSAMLRYMKAYPNECVLVVPNERLQDYVRDVWKAMHGAGAPRRVGDSAVHVPKLDCLTCDQGDLEIRIHRMLNKKILVDEYFLCGYTGPFYAAV